MIAGELRKRRPRLEEVYLEIDGRIVYLWRAVDSEGACHAECAVLGASIGEQTQIKGRIYFLSRGNRGRLSESLIR